MRCSNNENTDLILIEAKQFQDQQAGSQVLKQAQAIKERITEASVIDGFISVTWQELIVITVYFLHPPSCQAPPLY